MLLSMTIMLKKIFLPLAIALALTLNVTVASAQTYQGEDIISLLQSTLTNPSSLITFATELFLGIGLGYFSIKVIKYVLALIGIFVLGVLLNVWQSPQLGTNIQNQLTRLDLRWEEVSPVIMSIMYMIGLTTVLPITIGFLIGMVIAIVK